MSSFFFFFFLILTLFLANFREINAAPWCMDVWHSRVPGLEDNHAHYWHECTKNKFFCFTEHCIYQNNPQKYINVSGCTYDQTTKTCREMVFEWFTEDKSDPNLELREMECAGCKFWERGESQIKHKAEANLLEYPEFPTPTKTTTDKPPFFRDTTINNNGNENGNTTTTFGPAPEPQDKDDYDTSAAGTNMPKWSPIMCALLATMVIVALLVGSFGGIKHI